MQNKEHTSYQCQTHSLAVEENKKKMRPLRTRKIFIVIQWLWLKLKSPILYIIYIIFLSEIFLFEIRISNIIYMLL